MDIVFETARRGHMADLRADFMALDKMNDIDELYIMLYRQVKANTLLMQVIQDELVDPENVKLICSRIDSIGLEDDSH